MSWGMSFCFTAQERSFTTLEYGNVVQAQISSIISTFLYLINSKYFSYLLAKFIELTARIIRVMLITNITKVDPKKIRLYSS